MESGERRAERGEERAERGGGLFAAAGLPASPVKEFFGVDGGEEVAGGAFIGEHMLHSHEIILVGMVGQSSVNFFGEFLPKGGVEIVGRMESAAFESAVASMGIFGREAVALRTGLQRQIYGFFYRNAPPILRRGGDKL